MNLHRESEHIGAEIAAVASTVSAPDGLRERIDRRRTRRRRDSRLAVGLVATALALGIALTFTGGGPTVGDVALAALNPPTRPAPAVDPRDPRHIAVAVDGLAFPNYQRRWGWRAVGARADEVDGRRAVTVIYRRGRRGVHYTIVDGAPLARPESARRVGRFDVTRRAGADVVSWQRGGHTCVLASDSVGVPGLLRIAAW